MTRDRNQFQMCSQRKKDIGQDKGKSEDQEEEEMAKEEEKGAHGHQAPGQQVPVVKGCDGCVSGPCPV